MWRLWQVVVTCLIFTGAFAIQVIAQEDSPVCGTLIEDALDATNANCGGLARNQICYGNVELVAQPQEGVTDFHFKQPGDIVPVGTVRTLSLSSTAETLTDIWGVALMSIQANLPDSLPGQAVTFLLFGNVEIENAVEPDTIEPGAEPDTSEATMEADSENVPLTTMQAFYFESSVGDLRCREAPESGILVQTPQGAGKIELVANEVNISLGSTAYLQAQASADMTISLVEGEGEVSAFNVTVTVPAGYRTRVPLDADGIASGPPSEPEPYDPAELALLPIRILPRAITIAAPESTPEAPSAGVGSPLPGQYQWTTVSADEQGCPAGVLGIVTARFTPARPFQLPAEPFDIQLLMNSVFGYQPPPPSLVLSNPSPSNYAADFTDGTGIIHYEVALSDESHMEGLLTYTLEGCTMTINFSVERIGD